ncbi:MAG: chaperone NapD [Burkholderiaceae bacterium]|nr:chaperone NapD [Burkholderiaceae bacterium]
MNYSGLLVTSNPQELQATLKALKKMPNVEIYQVQEEASRCIIVMEGQSVADEVDGFKAISELPSVVDVSLIVHHFDEEAYIKPMTEMTPLN